MATHSGKGQLRIIGGLWRSRRLAVTAATGVRPTPDRVRETLFNWVQDMIQGARCLDLYAGSGALGFEALSRGAAEVVMVEHDIRLVQQLQQNAASLHTDKVEILWIDALEYLDRQGDRPFDLVFLDPPYREQMLAPCCSKLERNGLLARPAWIYLETGTHYTLPTLPDHWTLQREKQAGEVRYALARRD